MSGPRPRISPGTRLWRGGPIAWLGVFCALLLTFSQGFEALHLYLVPHRMCELHGLEHVTDGEAQAAAEPASQTGSAPTTASTPTRSLEGSHEQCSVLRTAQERLAVLGHSTWSPSTAPQHPTLLPLPPLDETRRPTASPLLLAPKQGPPA